MKRAYLASLILLGVIIGITSQYASAQLAENEAFTLEGNGYAISTNSVLPTTVDLQIIITKKSTTTEFSLQSGLISINEKELTISNFSGTLLKNGQFFKTSSTAIDSNGKEFSFKTLGKLIEKSQTNSIYSLSGTLDDSSNKPIKLIYTTKISEFITKRTDTSKKNEVTVRILKGSSEPQQKTYKNQIAGFAFKFFSEDRISVNPGGTITFVNEDTVSHSLKSGARIEHSKQQLESSFAADGKISSGDIQPGQSWSVSFKEPGFYRIFDEKYQWMDTTIFVIPNTNSKTLGGSGNQKN